MKDREEAFDPEPVQDAPDWRSTVRTIEDAWLDPLGLPLRDRMAHASWSPDEPEVYCDLCGGAVGPGEASEMGCAACRDSRLPWQRLVRLGEYAAPLDRWIREIKFERSFRLARQLGELLGERLAPVLEGMGIAREVVVVPAPMSARRRVARGIDHALEIATGVGRRLDAPVVRALRRRHRPSQRSVPASRRAANVAGAIRVRRERPLGERCVILVDDVLTSGATLRSCARAIRSAGASARRGGRVDPVVVIGAVLAATPPDDRRVVAGRSDGV